MPIYHKCAPRSPEWLGLRLGIPTSSNYHRILTPKTMKISSQAPAYMHILLGEWMTGEPVENFTSTWMDRGTELEDEAIEAFELITGMETSPGGFITDNTGMLGCSPDRLIGETSDLEIKCKLIQGQIAVALDGLEEEHVPQVQGRLMIEERESVYVFAYHPKLSIPPLKVYRDEKFIAAMKPALEEFVVRMLKAREELTSRFGPFVRCDPPEAQQHTEFDVSLEDVEAILASQARRGDQTLMEEQK